MACARREAISCDRHTVARRGPGSARGWPLWSAQARSLGAQRLDQSRLLCHRGLSLIQSTSLSKDALPNPPAALWQQRPVLTRASADFYNPYPWGAAFCTLSATKQREGWTARPEERPWSATSPTPLR